eukprot:scaffold1397_cov254-Pinguiococcus_pyrenoidosus.AAC.65
MPRDKGLHLAEAKLLFWDGVDFHEDEEEGALSSLQISSRLTTAFERPPETRAVIPFPVMVRAAFEKKSMYDRDRI